MLASIDDQFWISTAHFSSTSSLSLSVPAFLSDDGSMRCFGRLKLRRMQHPLTHSLLSEPEIE
jgi:hypothetical protein